MIRAKIQKFSSNMAVVAVYNQKPIRAYYTVCCILIKMLQLRELCLSEVHPLLLIDRTQSERSVIA
jgi:hypothetical protein